MKKFISILTTACIAATSMVGATMSSVNAADTMLFTYKAADGTSTVNVDVSAGAQTVDCNLFITEYAPVYTMGIKMQWVGPDGTAYLPEDNVYFKGTKAAYSDPSNFVDSWGDPDGLSLAMANAEPMNFVWQTGAKAEDEVTPVNGIFTDAGNAFIDMTFTVAADTPAGTYTLDIRREQFELEPGVLSSTKLSNTSSATVDYSTVPLTIVVSNGAAGTTESTTTTTTSDTTSATTTSTTTTTSGTTGTTGAIEGFTYKIDTVNAAAGETVSLPVYVYGDTGTAGITIRFDVDSALTYQRKKNGDAYTGTPTWNPATFDYIWNAGDGSNQLAVDGSVLTYINFVVPEDAADGTFYPVAFNHGTVVADAGEPRNATESVDTNGKLLGITYIDGGIQIGTDTTSSTTTTSDTTTTTTTTTSDTGTETETTTSSTTVTGTATPGDTNVDGKVTIADVVKLNKYLAGDDTLTPQGLINAEVNADGNVDNADSLKIMQFLAKIIKQDALGQK